MATQPVPKPRFTTFIVRGANVIAVPEDRAEAASKFQQELLQSAALLQLTGGQRAVDIHATQDVGTGVLYLHVTTQDLKTGVWRVGGRESRRRPSRMSWH